MNSAIVTIDDNSDWICLCQIEGIIGTISKKWAVLIISTLGNHGRMRFNEIMEDLKGISPRTLTDELKILEAEGLISRKSFDEIPPRVEYALTEDGKELRQSLVPLLEWAIKRDALREKPHVPRVPCIKSKPVDRDGLLCGGHK